MAKKKTKNDRCREAFDKVVSIMPYGHLCAAVLPMEEWLESVHDYMVDLQAWVRDAIPFVEGGCSLPESPDCEGCSGKSLNGEVCIIARRNELLPDYEVDSVCGGG